MLPLTLTLLGFPIDLPPDAQVALSYRANDLRNLGSREAPFSESFTLPLTAQLAQVLGSPHSLDSQTTTPYRLLPAELQVGGTAVLSGYAILELCHEGYDVTLTDAAGTLFAVVGDRPLRQLDLRAYDHTLGLQAMQAADANDYTRGYTYPLCDTGILAQRPPEQGLAPEELPAAVFVHAALTAMLADPLPPVPEPVGYLPPVNPLAGYRLTGSLLDEPLYQNLVLPRATAFPQLRAGYLARYTTKAYAPVERTYTTSNRLQFSAVTQGSLFAGELYSPPPHPIGLRFQVRLPLRAPLGFLFTTKLNLYQQDGPPGNRTQTILHSEPIANHSGEQVLAFDASFPVLDVKPDTLFFLALDVPVPLLVGVLIHPGASLSVTPLARSWPGAPVHLDAGLPDKSQADLLKLVFNQFNVLVQVDSVLRTIRLDLFNQVERRRAEAVNWSAKLDFTKRPRLATVLPGAAQRNTYAYGEAPQTYVDNLGLPAAPYDDEARGRGTLYCRNQTLALTTEAFATDLLLPLPHPTLLSRAVLSWLPFFEQANLKLAATPWDSAKTDYSNGNLVFYKGQVYQYARPLLPKPGAAPAWGVADPVQVLLSSWRLVADDYFTTLASDLPSVAALAPAPAGGLAVYAAGLHAGNYQPTRQLTRAGLEFDELLPAYSATLARILDRVQALTLDVRLSALDIATLDFTRPVRVSVPHVAGYGKLEAELYVNLIDQYLPGHAGSVSVGFIVLGDPVPGLAPLMPNPPLAALLAWESEDEQFLFTTEDGYPILYE